MVNPHSWLTVAVLGGADRPQTWSLEMGPPGALTRQGWTAQTVQAGDKVIVKLHPMKDGSYAGQLISVELPGGRRLWSGPGPGRGFDPEER